MITLLYHAQTNGYVCDRIARYSEGAIRTLSDRTQLPPRVDGTLIRWDSKAPLVAERTLNTAEAVALSRNKKESRIALAGLCPTTWTHWRDIQYPCLIRPKRHYGAENFFVCQNKQDGIKATAKCGFQRWYASPIIKKDKEFRVFVLNGEAFKVVRRFHNDPNAIAWNIANGGSSVRVVADNWPEKVVIAAVDAGERIKLDFYAADVIVDEADNPYVLELNTAPGLDRDRTIERVAELFVEASRG